MKRLALALALLLAATPAFAAKATVKWTNPSTFTTGAAIPANGLDHETIYWGTCVQVGTNAPTFGVQQGTQTVTGTVPGAQMSVPVYPTGTGPFCFYMTTTASGGGTSAPSNVVKWTPPVALGQPVVIVLHFGKRHDS